MNKNLQLSIGTSVPGPGDVQPWQLHTDSADLATCHKRPWLRAYIAKQLGVSTPGNRRAMRTVQDVGIDAALTAKHVLISAPTGEGKTRLLFHLVSQCLSAGYSVICLELKYSSILQYAMRARRAGLSPDRVVVVSPRFGDSVPGYNPLTAGESLVEAVNDFVAIVAKTTSSWGPRLQNALTAAATVCAAHGLTVADIIDLLLDAEMRASVLSGVPPENKYGRCDPVAYQNAVAFFCKEYNQWSSSARMEAAAPITNKLRGFCRSTFLSTMFSSPSDSIQFSRCFTEQRVALLHVDGPKLGDEVARILGALWATQALRSALRAPGRQPVVLLLDEIAFLQGLIGSTVREAVQYARASRLQVWVAAQYLSALSDELRSALLGSTGVQVLLRQGIPDAKLLGPSLAIGEQVRVRRVVASTAMGTKRPRSAMRHVVRDANGRPLRLDQQSWQSISVEQFTTSQTVIQRLYALAAAANIPRLYVKNPDIGGLVEIRHYVRGVPPADLWLEGPSPIALAISFPKPKISGVERDSEHDLAARWTRYLLDLQPQHAVVRGAGQRPQTVRITDVPEHSLSDEDNGYLQQVLHSHRRTDERQNRPSHDERPTTERPPTARRLIRHETVDDQEVQDRSIE